MSFFPSLYIIINVVLVSYKRLLIKGLLFAVLLMALDMLVAIYKHYLRERLLGNLSSAKNLTICKI